MLLALGVVATLCVIAALSAAGYVLAIAASAPDLSELKADDKGEISVVYAADGSRLGFVQSDTLRRVVPWKDMPVSMRRATVAIEDERFYKHDGVDLNAIVRAGVKNLESGETVQGGSTITQQLVRALYIKDPQRNFKRKIREAKLASELEERRSKTWILHQYLNSVPYGTVGGRTAIGVEAAAVTFFSKHARDLELHESALLAGLPQAPSQYNPFRNPQAALERRNEVLDQMVENGFITRTEAAEAANEKLSLDRGTRYSIRREPYFFDYVQEKLIERYGVGTARAGGLRIHTTIDPEMQQQARDAVNAYYADPAGPSSAIVAVDPTNGKIRAMASTGAYADRTFNIAAQGQRQPGSAFKTFVLTAAVLKGVDPDSTTYTSKPLAINDPYYGEWNVKTFGNTYSGTVTLTRATLASDNSVYAQLILDVGPKAVCGAAKRLGIMTKLDCYPAEGLGGLTRGVTTLEMAGAYGTLASGGVRHRPTGIERVVFPDGKSEKLTNPKGKRVMTDGQAYEVTRILEMNVQSGTGHQRQLRLSRRGQDRHHGRGQGRLVRGLHAEALGRRVGGLPRRRRGHAGRAGRHHGRPRVERLHVPGPRRFLRQLPPAHHAVRVLALLRQVLQLGRCGHRLLRLGLLHRDLQRGWRRWRHAPAAAPTATTRSTTRRRLSKRRTSSIRRPRPPPAAARARRASRRTVCPGASCR